MTVMILYLIENILSQIRYIGITDNLSRRLKEHNRRGKHFTSRMKGSWKLVGYRNFENEILAKNEEQRLKKSKNRKYIEWYFKNVESIVQRTE